MLIIKATLQFKHEICKICGNTESRTNTKAVLLIFLINNMTKYQDIFKNRKISLKSKYSLTSAISTHYGKAILDVGK